MSIVASASAATPPIDASRGSVDHPDRERDLPSFRLTAQARSQVTRRGERIGDRRARSTAARTRRARSRHAASSHVRALFTGAGRNLPGRATRAATVLVRREDGRGFRPTRGDHVNVIEIEGLAKEYRGRRGHRAAALDGLDLAIPEAGVFDSSAPTAPARRPRSGACSVWRARPAAASAC